MQPVFLLAFAYNPAEALPEVVNELKTIQRLLSQTGGNAETIWQATPDDLAEQFDTQRECLRLFHYSGHAGPTGLQLNRDGGEQASRIAFSDGIARQAGWAADLRLVFLNGCSTHEQAQVFLARGAGAVIATTKPLLDRYAVDFARRFYQNFTRRNGLSTLQQAFEAAFISFTDEHGNLTQAMLDEQVRGNIDLDEDANEPLYELHLHPDPQKRAVADQRFSEWFTEVKSSETEIGKRVEGKPGTPPPSADGKAEITNLLGDGDLEGALKKMQTLTQDSLVIQLMGRLNHLKREEAAGNLTTQERLMIRNQINNAALELLRGI